MEDNFYWINGDGEADHCEASYMLKSDLREHDERLLKEVSNIVHNYLYSKWFNLNGVKVQLPMHDLDIIRKLIVESTNGVD